jgi:UDP-glucose 4-epimerase
VVERVTAPTTVLITGGAGFIGSHLVDRMLAEGHRVVAIDDLSTGRLANLSDARRDGAGRFEFQRLDLTDPTLDRLVERHQPEVIHHVAAQINVRRSVEDPAHDARVNVLGTIGLLEAARRHGVRKVVFATSGGTIYGEPPVEELPIGEDHPLEAHSPYGASKIAGEHYLRTYEHLYGLEWTSLALSNVYGPRQDPSGEAGVVAIFTERMLTGQPAVIFGDGEQTRDFVHVDDTVHAFALAMDRGSGERFNIGTGERTSVNELFEVIARLIGYDDDPVYADERPGELRHNAVDPRRAGDELEWRPWTELEAGLEPTISWTREEMQRSA